MRKRFALPTVHMNEEYSGCLVDIVVKTLLVLGLPLGFWISSLIGARNSSDPIIEIPQEVPTQIVMPNPSEFAELELPSEILPENLNNPELGFWIWNLQNPDAVCVAVSQAGNPLDCAVLNMLYEQFVFEDGCLSVLTGNDALSCLQSAWERAKLSATIGGKE